jgi:hypothetical protein
MKSAPASNEVKLSETARGILSLLIFIHLFCVLTVVASNFRRSELLTRLVDLFSPYTQLLNFDPNFAPYYLTLGRPIDDDAVLVVELYPDGEAPVSAQTLLKTVTLPDRGGRWNGSRQRYIALAKLVHENSPLDREPTERESQVAITVAASMGRRLMDENQARRAVVRCVHRMSQPRRLDDLDPGFPPDHPADPAYDVTVYMADVWIDEEGRTQRARRAAARELAPRTTENAP